ncbi:MAG: Uncharacterized protein CEN91_309 [Candidatus Berkelbacteria bacterium Licking1014_85]|uniref:LTD domain-containing protein n=1 Tax=Candidatus Berkelbacteria bacterium Licking1014_85 TaxID=2017148 RepID=A0A554LJJ9_9BACT|nr:MAG: Uncharacterized protein CEN91_309 [Candidatus Berkelbacteria bacterium Licking1014_85]
MGKINNGWIIIYSLLLVLSFNYCQAETKSIIINEIAWAGSSISPADEWVELYNSSESDIDLNHYYFTSWDGDEDKILFELEGILKSKDYYLISNNSKNHIFSKGESILNIDPDFISSKMSLSNDHLSIKLYNSDSIFIDEAGERSEPSYGSNNPYISMQRNIDLSWSNSIGCINLDICENDLGTPRSANIYPENNIISGQYIFPDPPIIISEIYPYPATNEEEYIVIQNLSQNHFQLTGFYLMDFSGKKYYLDDIRINPKEKLKLSQSATKIYLNNSGDEELKLINPNGIILSALKYSDSIKQTKFAYANNRYDWQTTTTTTQTVNSSTNNQNPSINNNLLQSEPMITPDIADYSIKNDQMTKIIYYSTVEQSSEFMNGLANLKPVQNNDFVDILNVSERIPVDNKSNISYNEYLLGTIFMWSIVCGLSQKKSAIH